MCANRKREEQVTRLRLTLQTHRTDRILAGSVSVGGLPASWWGAGGDDTWQAQPAAVTIRSRLWFGLSVGLVAHFLGTSRCQWMHRAGGCVSQCGAKSVSSDRNTLSNEPKWLLWQPRSLRKQQRCGIVGSDEPSCHSGGLQTLPAKTVCSNKYTLDAWWSVVTVRCTAPTVKKFYSQAGCASKMKCTCLGQQKFNKLEDIAILVHWKTHNIILLHLLSHTFIWIPLQLKSTSFTSCGQWGTAAVLQLNYMIQ